MLIRHISTTPQNRAKNKASKRRCYHVKITKEEGELTSQIFSKPRERGKVVVNCQKLGGRRFISKLGSPTKLVFQIRLGNFNFGPHIVIQFQI